MDSGLEPDRLVFSCLLNILRTVETNKVSGRRNQQTQRDAVRVALPHNEVRAYEVEYDRHEFESTFTKSVQVPNDRLPPVFGNRKIAPVAPGPSLLPVPNSKGHREKINVEERARLLAKTSVRLGDYAKARQLLVDLGDIGGARQLLGDALTVELLRRGEAHPVVAQIRDELEALGLEHSTKPSGKSILPTPVLPKTSGPPRNEMELRAAMALETSDIASKSLQRRRLDPERVRGLFDAWALEPGNEVNGTNGEMAQKAVTKLGHGAESRLRTLSRDALGVVLLGSARV
jgi:hypothetical protein